MTREELIARTRAALTRDLTPEELATYLAVRWVSPPPSNVVSLDEHRNRRRSGRRMGLTNRPCL
jgi:hypothetical protein